MPLFTSGVKQIIHSAKKTQLWSGGLSPLGHKSHRHPHLDKASCGNARSDCVVSMDGARSTFPRESYTGALRGVKNAKPILFRVVPCVALVCAELVLRLWECGNPEMHLPILKNPRFLLAGTTFVFVYVSKGFALKAHPQDPPDDLVTCSLCQVGRGLSVLMLITSG